MHSSPESRDNVAYNRTEFALCSYYWQSTHSLSCVGPSLEDCAPRRTTAQDRGQRLSIPTEQVYGRNAVHYLQSGVIYYLSVLRQTDRQTDRQKYAYSHPLFAGDTRRHRRHTPRHFYSNMSFTRQQDILRSVITHKAK